MVVIANAEALRDQVADHRAGPDARLIAGLHRPQLDDDRQGLALLGGELRGRTFGNRGAQSRDVIGVVPLQPAVHRAARDIEVGRDRDHAPAIDIRPHGATTAPFAKVILALCFDNKLVELLQLHASAAGAPDRLPCLGLRHDQRTMILSRSAVKLDPKPRDPV